MALTLALAVLALGSPFAYRLARQRWWLHELAVGPDRERALHALAPTPSRAVVEAFAECVRTGEGELSRIAAEYLGRMGARAERAIPALIDRLTLGREIGASVITAPDGSMALFRPDRSAAADALVALGSFSVPPLIRTFSRRREFYGDQRVGEVLSRIGDRAFRALVAELDGRDNSFRSRIAAVVADPKWGKSVVPLLRERLLRDDYYERSWAANVLGRCGDRAASASTDLRTLAGDSSELPVLRAQCARALVRVDPRPEIVPTLVRLLDDDDLELRRTAIQGLGYLGPAAEPAAARIAQLFGEPEAELLHHAHDALERIGVAAVPAVIDVLADRGELAAERAFQSLWALGGRYPETVPILIGALAHASGDVRTQVERVLDFLGPQSRPALVHAATAPDTEREVRAAAKRVLGRME